MSVLKQKQQGFTLVELIVSIAIAAVFMAAATTIIIQNTRIGQRARDLTATNSFIENKVESLRSAGYLALTDGTTDITAELPDELNQPRSGSLTIGPTVSPSTTSVKKAVITVTYNNQGSQKTHTYTTYVGELGVGQY